MCHRKRQSISFYDEIFTHIDQSKSNFSLHQFEDNFSAGNCSRRWINENQYQCEGKQTRWHTVRHWVMNISVMRLHMLSSSSKTRDPAGESKTGKEVEIILPCFITRSAKTKPSESLKWHQMWNKLYHFIAGSQPQIGQKTDEAETSKPQSKRRNRKGSKRILRKNSATLNANGNPSLGRNNQHSITCTLP